jgi:predicted nucleic acid-binding Zn ribbon protein
MSGYTVVNHAHCWVCGKAMAFDEDKEGPQTCSEACAEKLKLQNKKRQRMMWFLYGAMGLTLLLLLLGLRG